MTATTDGAPNQPERGRPPRAYVGSQISQDEEMFGALFDGGVVRRFMTYVRPYRRQVLLAIAAVLVVTGAATPNYWHWWWRYSRR